MPTLMLPPPPDTTLKQWGASSGSHDSSAAETARMYDLEVTTSSLKTMHSGSGLRPNITEVGWMLTSCPPAMVLNRARVRAERYMGHTSATPTTVTQAAATTMHVMGWG